MPVLPSTNIDDTPTFGLMRLTEKIDIYSSHRSGWKFYRVEKVFIEVTQFMPPTNVGHIPLLADLSTKKGDRKSTRLNSSHDQISYAVFCLKKKKKKKKYK